MSFGISTGVCFSKKVAELASAPMRALFFEPYQTSSAWPCRPVPFDLGPSPAARRQSFNKACDEVRAYYDHFPVGTDTLIGGPSDCSIVPEWFQVEQGKTLGEVTDSTHMFIGRCTEKKQLDTDFWDIDGE